jgi:hypothetical protein
VVDSLDLGPGVEGPFRALYDDDVVPLVKGPQGGEMVPVRLRITGPGAPACLPQRTRVEAPAGTLAAESSAALST